MQYNSSLFSLQGTVTGIVSIIKSTSSLSIHRLSEIWLSNLISDNKILPQTYNFYRRHTKLHKGGVLFVVRIHSTHDYSMSSYQQKLLGRA
jgi:hypothetical protein